MAKLSELFNPEKPGSVKVRRKFWSNKDWFQPYYVTSDGRYNGPLNECDHDFFYDDDNWVLFEEPKPKTVVYEWMIKRHPSLQWELSTHLYSEDAAKNIFESLVFKYRKTGRIFEV